MKAAVAIPSTAPINFTLSKNQSMPGFWHIWSQIRGAARRQPLRPARYAASPCGMIGRADFNAPAGA